jgi:hypothetical protein
VGEEYVGDEWCELFEWKFWTWQGSSWVTMYGDEVCEFGRNEPVDHLLFASRPAVEYGTALMVVLDGEGEARPRLPLLILLLLGDITGERGVVLVDIVNVDLWV